MFEFAKFSSVGLINTIVGYSVIFTLIYTGVNEYAANAYGYAVGLSISYVLNCKLTFKSHKFSLTEIAGYSLSVSFAYIVNIAIILTARMIGISNNPITHIIAMIGYSLTFYILARTFAFGPNRSIIQNLTKRCIAQHKHSLWLFAFAIVTMIVIRDIDLSHDVVWQFWIARQILGGSALYSDIWEINPPLWFWSAVPIQYFGEILNISPLRMYIGVIVAMGFLSASLVGQLNPALNSSRKLAILIIAFWVMVPMPLYDFGQREQLALICTLPYAALISQRFAGNPVSPRLSTFVGLFAAYGFALKHYFVVIPVFLEIWIIIKYKRNWRIIRPETIMLVTCALIYVTSIILFTPEFIFRMVPMIVSAYHGYEVPFSIQMQSPIPKAWLAILVCIALYRKIFCENSEPFVAALLLTAVGFAFAFFVQHKGWLYHTIPVTGALLLMLTMRITRDGIGKISCYPLGLFVLTFVLTFGVIIGPYRNFLPYSKKLLSTVAKGDSVLVVASDPMWYWPAGEQYGLRWPSSLYSFWMIPAIADAEVHGIDNNSLHQLGIDVLRQTYTDMRCHPPAMILVERKRTNIAQPESFNVLSFFTRNSDIREFLTKYYRRYPSTDRLYVYRRIIPVPLSSGNPCRPIR